ncbi:hypothetical protein PVAP13_5NG109742 [Panicum virgatum]|uniref:Uncharacterized protein n=1 Tax=Panicum virgatum TaxID=38727 RepID=A0A8T0S4P6_PANVG|nr:hypothetical protein PVAP13_5NG109742 [Panicum virgatum]
MDARVPLDCEMVRRDALQQLRIPEHSGTVSKLREATFLLRFDRPELRNAALRRGPLMAGRTRLHIMPWSRQFGASDNKLMYRVRVCIEGVPAHATQEEIVAKLLPPSVFIEKFDYELVTEDEKACMCLWVWAVDPDAIAKEGLLKLEEPVEFSEEHHNDFFTRSGNMELPVVRAEAARMLDYPVLIHLDRIVDYCTPPRNPSWRSFESATSGIPDDSVDVEWPVNHKLYWQLGTWRIPVHERLGERRRDLSPPGGGGGRGNQMQFPPASWHDINRGTRAAEGSSRQGHFGSRCNGGYQRREAGECGGAMADVAGAEEDGGETKLPNVTAQDITETLAQGTRGGALVAVDEDYHTITHSEFREHIVSVCITSNQCLATWWITVVYGPQGDSEKIEFLRELRELMAEFSNTLNFLELKELKLRGRKYTWSNDVTQTRIDRAFCTVDWDLMLPDSTLEAQSSMAMQQPQRSEGFTLKVFGPSCRDTLRQFKQCGTDLYMFTTHF